MSVNTYRTPKNENVIILEMMKITEENYKVLMFWSKPTLTPLPFNDGIYSRALLGSSHHKVVGI